MATHTELKVYEAQSQGITRQVEAFQIETTGDYEYAVAVCQTIKEHVKGIKDFFEDSRKKTHAAYKGVTDDISRYTKEATEAEKILRGKMGDWHTEQQKARMEEERALREQAEKEGFDSDQIVIEQPPEPKGITYRKVWKWRLLNIEEVPPFYLRPDEEKIGSYVRHRKDLAKISGIEVYSVDSPVMSKGTF